MSTFTQATAHISDWIECNEKTIPTNKASQWQIEIDAARMYESKSIHTEQLIRSFPIEKLCMQQFSSPISFFTDDVLTNSNGICNVFFYGSSCRWCSFGQRLNDDFEKTKICNFESQLEIVKLVDLHEKFCSCLDCKNINKSIHFGKMWRDWFFRGSFLLPPSRSWEFKSGLQLHPG